MVMILYNRDLPAGFLFCLAICVFQQSVSQIINSCTRPTPCFSGHVTAFDPPRSGESEEDCQMYYKCINGAWVKQRCAKNLKFDRDKMECIRPDQNATCQERCEFHTDIPCYTPLPCEDGMKVVKADDQKCHQYWECVAGAAWELKECPRGQVFAWYANPLLSAADLCVGQLHSRYPCRNFSQICVNLPTDTPCTGSRSCTGEITTIPDQFDCKKFYTCTEDGYWRHVSCIQNRKFDIVDMLCKNYWEEVSCLQNCSQKLTGHRRSPMDEKMDEMTTVRTTSGARVLVPSVSVMCGILLVIIPNMVIFCLSS